MNRLTSWRLPRAFSLVELLVVLGIIVVVVVVFFSARPMRAAHRLELIAGSKKIAEWNDRATRKNPIWEFKIPHCERLVNYCKGDPRYKEWSNPDGTREDKDVVRLDELIDLRAAAYSYDPPKPFTLDNQIDALRQTLEDRYLNPPLPQ
ncbi:MAG: prepilin-type N-terminal cleavage/methylation domain-containing protein [Phycisphaerae bacterium]|nr:prepilin-type N-terminal cleavage/methylation domain-containing protein [Phycisphaerae bacterium]